MNHVENRFHAKNSPDTLRLGLVFLRLRNDKLKHVATARPLLLGGAERGVSIRRVIRYSVALRNSARNRFPLTVTQIRLTFRSGQPGCKPFLRAPVGSNTETDDDCRPATFHRGRFRCEAPFSIHSNRWKCGYRPWGLG